MIFLTPSELRHTLKISRSTEHRLLKSGMPSIGRGRLRRYDQEAAVAWFRTYAHQANSSKNILTRGDYKCQECGFLGHIEQPMAPGPCPHCGSKDVPRRVNALGKLGTA